MINRPYGAVGIDLWQKTQKPKVISDVPPGDLRLIEF